MEQVFVWIVDNFLGALLSACFGALLGICGSNYYFRYKSSVRQTQKSGNNSTNIQVNGDFEDNKIND